MKQRQSNKQSARCSKSTIPVRRNVKLMTDAAMQLNRICMGNTGTKVCETELKSVRNHIRNFISTSGDPFENYLKLCEQIIISHEHIIEYPIHPLYMIPGSCKILIYNEWLLNFEERLHERHTMPHTYRLEIRSVAESMLDRLANRESKVFADWKQWYARKKDVHYLDVLDTWVSPVLHETSFL